MKAVRCSFFLFFSLLLYSFNRDKLRGTRLHLERNIFRDPRDVIIRSVKNIFFVCVKSFASFVSRSESLSKRGIVPSLSSPSSKCGNPAVRNLFHRRNSVMRAVRKRTMYCHDVIARRKKHREAENLPSQSQHTRHPYAFMYIHMYILRFLYFLFIIFNSEQYNEVTRTRVARGRHETRRDTLTRMTTRRKRNAD